MTGDKNVWINCVQTLEYRCPLIIKKIYENKKNRICT